MLVRMVATSFLYEHLADDIGKAIDRGALRGGDRLPSVRRLAEERKCSVATVLEAYLRLENAGLIEVRPKSGHFVRRRQLASPEPRVPRPVSTPSRITTHDAYAKILEAMRDPELLPFGCANTDPDYLPIAALNRIISQVTREMTTLGARYEVAPGLLTLRRQIARRGVGAGMALSERDLCTTNGATEGLSLALRTVGRPGDVIAVESPTYFGMLQSIAGMGMRALEIPAHPRNGLDVDALEEAMKTQQVAAVMLTPTISNPLGSIMPDDAREKLVEITRRRGIAIIEDDVYGELVFDGSRPRPLRAFAPDDSHVIHVSSVSKTLAPGYRVGWIAGGRWHDEIVRGKYSHSLACPTLPGMAIAEFLSSGGYDRHLRRLRGLLAANLERYRDAITQLFPAGTRVSTPRGGYVLWVELPAGCDALELHERALAKRIVIAPGPLFSARNRFANFIRISAGAPWNDRIEEGLRTLARLLSTR